MYDMTVVRTKGNGSGSSLVKQLVGYYEESVRCTQHRLKRKKLLERDQPVVGDTWGGGEEVGVTKT